MNLIHTAADVGKAIEDFEGVEECVSGGQADALEASGIYLDALKFLLFLEQDCHRIVNAGGEEEDIMAASAEFAGNLHDRVNYGNPRPDIQKSQLLRLSGSIVNNALNKLAEDE